MNATANGNKAETLQGLLSHHLEQLRASGLSDATIQAAGLRSESRHVELATLLNWRAMPKRMSCGLVFPFGSNGYARFKPDTPRTVGGKVVKYESPRGQPNHVYVPAAAAHTLADASIELLVTEGEKKALKATQEGFACLGLVGVFGWKDGRREAMLPELERIAWQGRPTFIVYDSDAAERPEIQDAEARLAMHLGNRGARVRVVRLPPGPDGAKMGLDDYLVAHGPAALRKLLDTAEEPTPPDAVSMKAPAACLDPCSEVEAFLKADEIDGTCRLRFWRGAFCRWTAGAYRELQGSEVRAYLVRKLNASYNRLTTGIVANLLDQLRAQALLPSATEAPAWLGEPPRAWKPDEIIAARNGLVHLPSLLALDPRAILPQTPRFFCLGSLDYDIDQDAPQPAAWHAFLRSLWPTDQDSITTLQQWFGYCLRPDTRFQKILLLVGPKRSGKGTVGRILQALVGRENTAGPTLASLGTQFGLWPLLNKSVAIISDARLGHRSDQAQIMERLLSISGEDPITIDRKSLEPVTVQLGCRLVLLTNELPRFNDPSGAIASRFIILRLTESWYGKEDHGLLDKIMPELPGIFNWAAVGWQRLRTEGRFKEPDSSKELHDTFADLTSPIGAFIADCCGLGPEYDVPVSDLFNAWCEWCKQHGRKEPGTEQTFGRDLHAAVPNIKSTQPRDGERRYRAYNGIHLV